MPRQFRSIDRRDFLFGTSAAVASVLVSKPSAVFANEISVTGRHNPALQSFDDLMLSFVEKHEVPGASLAVTRHGKLVYARGFGLADVEKKEAVKPEALFRIASIAKTFTAAGVIHLVEKGKIKLDTKAFGYLDLKPHLDEKSKEDSRIHDITIQQLLNHTGGFDRDKSFDPMFRPIVIANALGVDPPAQPEHIIRYMMGKPLDFEPGKRYAYSNFGYCVLGRVIEKASGMKYDDYTKKEILGPLGIRQSRIGKTLQEGRAPGEVKYYDPKKRMRNAVIGKMIGEPVPLPYGAWFLEAMDSHGGWISSAIDLVRFASAFDEPKRCKILSETSIRSLFARPRGEAGYDSKGKARDNYYACGWQIHSFSGTNRMNTFHTGRLDGTSTLLVRRSDGLNWAVLFNTHADANGVNLSGAIDPLVHQAAGQVKSWPNIDLFEK